MTNSPRRLRILVLTETLAAGGAETFVVRLANALSQAGHDVTIAVMHGELVNPALGERLDPGVRVERLLLPAKRWLFRVDRALRLLGIDLPLLHLLQKRWLKGIVARDRPQIIHSHLLKADWLASELRAANPGLRHLLTVHGDYAAFLAGQADPQVLDVTRRAASIVANADAIVGVSNAQLVYFRARYGVTPRKLHLIYNGYAPPAGGRAARSRSELGLPDGKFLFGMVSRGVEQKGWGKAVAAFERLGRDDAALILVGEGPYIDRLRNRGTTPEVILTGFSANPLGYIRHFDVGLLPTLFPHESLPTVVMEYLFCGKPVIATDVGEIGAMISAPGGEKAGALLDFSDGTVSVAELAEAMRRMMDAPDLRRRQSALARQAFAKFDMDECVERYLALYEAVGTDSGPSSSPINPSH